MGSAYCARTYRRARWRTALTRAWGDDLRLARSALSARLPQCARIGAAARPRGERIDTSALGQAHVAIELAVASAHARAIFRAIVRARPADAAHIAHTAHRLVLVIAERRVRLGTGPARDSAAAGTARIVAGIAGAAAATRGASDASRTSDASRASRAAGSAGTGGAGIGAIGAIVRAATERCKGRTPNGNPKRTSTVQR
jgi:hypothetical protein